ncbi:ABC transporter permease subunit [Streptomyces sp. 3MP-14]|uniref:ABC transporter permease subunit n=1 Tax=Streptomyces mimosae TaxID=2586635 RepID=A0A5N6A1U4_9ACTN|nr:MULTISPECIES: carbohydrate ABC transporter permease [Streptomyces]KAB8161308.1 ABC transporter permease subunit [Streptomyces mimosae]KAB8173110.1 ABC transporter permease subunit [Streptomyces sp. 3MP-14]
MSTTPTAATPPTVSTPPAVSRPPARRRLARGAGRAGQYLALACYLVFLGFPLVWLLSTALKSPQELGSINPTWIPEHPTLENFRIAFDTQPLLRSALNSALVATSSAVIAVAIAVPAAYVMVRYRSRISQAGTVWVLVSQMFPFVLVIIPLFLVLRNLHLINALPGLVVVYVVWNLPFSLWMLRGYVQAVPVSLEEAAAMDGASRLRTLTSVVLPLLTPGLVATLMFSFVTAWNEFFFALVLLKSPEKQTMSVILTHFIGAEGVADLGPLAAAALVATLPSLLFFALLQRRLVSGMLAGAVKA